MPTEIAALRGLAQQRPVANAWRRYLRETRRTGAEDYEEVEERAWVELRRALGELERLQAPGARRP